MGKSLDCGGLNLLLVLLESSSKYSPCFNNIDMITTLAQDLVYTGSGVHSQFFYCPPLCLLDALIFSCVYLL